MKRTLALAAAIAAMAFPLPSFAQDGVSDTAATMVEEAQTRDAQAMTESQDARSQRGGGYVTGSLESNSIAYVNDEGIGFRPSDHFGSNDYLKVDYVSGRFSAGIQAEAYLPALQGFDFGPDPKKFFLGSKYIRWSDRHFDVQAGDIYSQFGNGLIFRSHEDRQLGFNNSIEGVYAGVNFGRFLSAKAICGRPRLYTGYAGSFVRGADLVFSLSELVNMGGVNLSFEGGYINRHEALDKEPDSQMEFGSSGLTSPDVSLWSAGLNLDWTYLYLKAEYAAKGLDLYDRSAPLATKGRAIYAELGVNAGGFSLSGSFRILDRMNTALSLYGTGTGNTLNYLPALTRQYTYMLANLNPYQVNTEGEIGGQVDAYYNFRSRNNRHRRFNFHANFSSWHTLFGEQTLSEQRNLLWQDINADAECQWGRSLKTTFLVSVQRWNPSHGFEDETYMSTIAVADILYKINKKYSVRGEIQYLYSADYEGDWVAGLFEFSFAPKWSFFVSDMYNLGTTRRNYYNAGFSYTHSRTRVMLGYGRNREGFICSGGVCRYTPAYTGANLTLTTSF